MEQKLSNVDLMKIAIEEQSKCTSFPKVGAVIAKDGKVLAKAFKNEEQNKHAERIAIEKLDQSILSGATIVTTLEPCVNITNEQPFKSCTDLIIDSGINTVIIGILDPNGKVYCQGYKKLLDNKIKVDFFTSKLRENLEATTFEYDDCGIGYGPGGQRRVAVVASGKNFKIQFSKEDSRSIEFQWNTLQFQHGCVDLYKGDKDSVRCAIGAKNFKDITKPLVFREPSHYARMKVGDIAIIAPTNSTFLILIKLLGITETDITFQWEVRNK
jgi:diaminohydroxyphosphoribosylaminopyrimidine deaminase/5-amino-6-(5-phosphoribosylamino)uracil reductase